MTSMSQVGVGRRAESGATPGPEGEGTATRQPGGSSAPDISTTAENSAFHRSSADSDPRRITRAIKLEIAKPLDRTWDELGAMLRLYRSVMHRLYNAAIFGTGIEQAAREKVFELPGKAKSASGRAYQLAKRELDELREWGARQNGEHPYAKLNLSGSVLSAVSLEAYASYMKWVKAKGSMSLPSYKKGAPIPINAVDYSLSEENGKVSLTFKLEGKKPGESRADAMTVAICATRGTHWSRLLELARGNHEKKLGQLKILLDERSKKWMVVISYSYVPPEPSTELLRENVMVVHRGQHNLLTVLDNQLHFRVVERGNKYKAQRRGLTARGIAARRVTASERGAGAKGHGTARRFITHSEIQDKIARINKTTCQRLAATVVKLALQWQCGRVVIEDYGGIDNKNDSRAERRFIERFPNFQLKAAVKGALEKVGLELEEVPSLYLSNKCPRCGHCERGQSKTRDVESWELDVVREKVFTCTRCRYQRASDFVAGVHMLRLSGADMSAWDKRFELEQALADARAASGADDTQQESNLDVGPKKGKKRTARKPPRKVTETLQSSEVG